MTNERKIERDLSVLWQRHIPEGYGKDNNNERVAAVCGMVDSMEASLNELGVYEPDGPLDRGDLVLTLSLRPPLKEATP